MRFDSIDACRSRVLNALNGTSPPPGLSLVLNYEQCLQYCGTGWGPYPKWSAISALTDWVIPLFLLLGNITCSKIASTIFPIRGKYFGAMFNWFSVVSHLLVNPLDFLWSLALKLDSGLEIKERVDGIEKVKIDDEEKKQLCGICYSLEDFENGIHVNALLQPLEGPREKENVPEVTEYWEAIRHELKLTARNIAGERRHNKFHSALAIIVYAKDVFVALIQAELDKDFPYHMPHTLALRQLYYWLFLAILLSAAAGGFADQWSSHAFLDVFLKAREKNWQARPRQLKEQSPEPRPQLPEPTEQHQEAREHLQEPTCQLRESTEQYQELTLQGQEPTPQPQNPPFEYESITLQPIEPWDGGNYNWRYPKRGQSDPLWSPRRSILLALVILAVAAPGILAFIMSYMTPTEGLGDRTIVELAYCSMWLLNWIITIGASYKWDGEALFKIYYWNMFLSVGSLFVLFAAFQGWYNNCASWSAYFSRGASGAYLDLNMKDIIEKKIFSFYLPMTAGSLFIQLSLAMVVIWITWDVFEFTIWSNENNRSVLITTTIPEETEKVNGKNPSRQLLLEEDGQETDSMISRSRTCSWTRTSASDEERGVVNTTEL